MSYRNRNNIKNIKPEELEKLFEIGKVLHKAIEAGDTQKQEEMGKSRPLLMQLLEYLVMNLDKPDIDKSLILILKKFLGLGLEEDKSEELEEEKEEELDIEEKKQRLRFAIYEVYKILNPHRLAGETHIENFINNVKTRGVNVAMKYEGHEYAKMFRKEDLENVGSHKKSFTALLEKGGNKGFGHGI